MNTETLQKALADSSVSLVKLSKLSGISRVQIHRISSGKVKQVRKSTVEKLGKALASSDKSVQDEPFNAYRRLIETQLGKVKFSGFGLPDLVPQNLHQVFVEPHAVLSPSTRDGCREFDSNLAEHASGSQGVFRPQPVLSLLDSVPRAMILGGPGSGKSTLLARLACGSADGKQKSEIPIHVRLPEYIRAIELSPGMDFVTFVARRARELGCSEVHSNLLQALEDDKQRVLVLLDGLDEVQNETERQTAVKVTLEFVAKYPRNLFVVCSREAGFDGEPWRDNGFSVIRLKEFGDSHIEAMVTNWSAILAKSFYEDRDEDRDELRTKLQCAMQNNARVRQIATNPLILTIMIFLCLSRGYALPRRRVDLYAKVAEVFLDSWEASKRLENGRSETATIDLDSRELGWLIADLALEMQKGQKTTVPRWWLTDRFEQALVNRIGLSLIQAKQTAERLLRYVSERTGLLEPRALDVFAFSHRTLQEYFAAIGAIEDTEASGRLSLGASLREHLFCPNWTEVIRLIAAQVTPRRAEELFRVMLDDPDSSGRFLRRGTHLALCCLADGTTIADRKLITQLFTSFHDLGASPWLGITFRVLQVLDSFRDTRHEQEAKVTREAILERAKTELAKEDYENLLVEVCLNPEDIDSRLPADFQNQAATEVSISIRGVDVSMCVLNFGLRASDPERWHSSAVQITEDNSSSKRLKWALMSHFARVAKTHPRSRVRLKHVLSDKAAEINLRILAAHGLGDISRGRGEATNMLLRRLRQESNASLRSACAAALVRAARENQAIRTELLSVLENESDETVRVGAANGLHDAAEKDSAVADRLHYFANTNVSPKLQNACVRSLETLVGRSQNITESYREWLHGADFRARLSAQVLADAMTENRINWDFVIAERIEQVLTSVGAAGQAFGLPCPHALEALKNLVDARELRHGVRIERVLHESLQAIAFQMELAFVFGSVAGERQHAESDIDVMVIGAASLKSLSSPLRDAERTLGRRINPVIYSRESFCSRLHSGDPFLTDVLRNPKIPLFIFGQLCSQTELENELRAMAAERLAAS